MADNLIEGTFYIYAEGSEDGDSIAFLDEEDLPA